MTSRLALCVASERRVRGKPAAEQPDIVGTIRVATEFPTSPVIERHVLVALEEPGKDGEEKVLFLVTNSTEVRRDGEVVSVAALAVGQRVLAWRGANRTAGSHR